MICENGKLFRNAIEIIFSNKLVTYLTWVQANFHG
jgi:hypothetical protein